MVFLFNGASLNETIPVPDYAGEFMQYDLRYSVFKIGVASISCFEDPEGYGEIIKAEAQSTGLLKIFKDLDYRFECCMDPVTGQPKSALMDLRDGNTTSYCETQFDYHSRNDSAIVLSQTTGKHVVPKDIYDILTGFYHFRKNYYTESIMDKKPVVIQTFIADMLWDLRITYSGGETINTMYGWLSCQRFISSTVVGSFFHQDDDMTIWFTQNDVPIPIKIQLNLRLGCVKGELEKYHPVNSTTTLQAY
jgi:hypothetical protein